MGPDGISVNFCYRKEAGRIRGGIIKKKDDQRFIFLGVNKSYMSHN